MGDHIGFANTSCCNNYHFYTKKGKPRQEAPAQEKDLCCPRLVIEAVKDRKTFPAQVLELTSSDDHFGMALDEKRLPEGSREVELSWLAVSFESKAGSFTTIIPASTPTKHR